MVAYYRMSSQILNKISRLTLLRQRCSPIHTSQYRNGAGGGTTDIDANPNYHQNPDPNAWRQVEPYLDVAQRTTSPLEHYKVSPWQKNFGYRIHAWVIFLALWTMYWAHHTYNDVLIDNKKNRREYLAKFGLEDLADKPMLENAGKGKPEIPLDVLFGEIKFVPAKPWNERKELPVPDHEVRFENSWGAQKRPEK